MKATSHKDGYVILARPKMIDLWLEKQRSPHTRWCYRYDSERFVNHTAKPLRDITLGDLQRLGQALGMH